MKWDLNTGAITKKGHQRRRLLRKLRSLDVDSTILKLLYNSFIENILLFSFLPWFYNLNTKQRNSLRRIVNFSSKIKCSHQVRTLSLFCDYQILHKEKTILKDNEHVLYGEFESLPHGQYSVHKTNRRGNSFVPTAIRLLKRA